jgi:hypothetical protein
MQMYTQRLGLEAAPAGVVEEALVTNYVQSGTAMIPVTVLVRCPLRLTGPVGHLICQRRYQHAG